LKHFEIAIFLEKNRRNFNEVPFATKAQKTMEPQGLEVVSQSEQ